MIKLLLSRPVRWLLRLFSALLTAVNILAIATGEGWVVLINVLAAFFIIHEQLKTEHAWYRLDLAIKEMRELQARP